VAAIPDDVNRLVRTLFEPPSLLDRVRRQDPRRNILEQIAASGELRVVPALLEILARKDSLSDYAAPAIAQLVRRIAPAQLAWLDEQARRWYEYGPTDAWSTLRPEDVPGLARRAGFDPAVIGLLASHGSGFVRAAVLEELARIVDGREIPFLVLRANDWVEPVAARALELLAHRLRPENRLPCSMHCRSLFARSDNVAGIMRRSHLCSGRCCCRMVVTKRWRVQASSTQRYADSCTSSSHPMARNSHLLLLELH
jgi:hypothetical protein